MHKSVKPDICVVEAEYKNNSWQLYNKNTDGTNTAGRFHHSERVLQAMGGKKASWYIGPPFPAGESNLGSSSLSNISHLSIPERFGEKLPCIEQILL